MFAVVETSGTQPGRRRCGKLRSFFSCAIAPKTFLREVPLTLREQLCPVWQTLMCRMRIPHRKATPYNATCGQLGPVGSSHRINGWTRVALAGGISSRLKDDLDRTTITESVCSCLLGHRVFVFIRCGTLLDCYAVEI